MGQIQALIHARQHTEAEQDDVARAARRADILRCTGASSLAVIIAE
jgi:hypothetical protein